MMTYNGSSINFQTNLEWRKMILIHIISMPYDYQMDWRLLSWKMSLEVAILWLMCLKTLQPLWYWGQKRTLLFKFMVNGSLSLKDECEEEVKAISIYETDKENWHQQLTDYLKYGKLPSDLSIKQKSNEKPRAFSITKEQCTHTISLITSYDL